MSFHLVSFLVIAGCCQKLLISHKENSTNAFQAHKMIFNIYEIENNTINGKAHYTSDDGAMGLWFGDCGHWQVGHPTGR